jgi:ribonucleotide monophosphatase NagD (HAD superfamily)
MTARPITRADACIVDLDGTLYFGGQAIAGAAEAVSRIRSAGVALRFATNTTRYPRHQLVQRLAAMGVGVGEEELHTAPVAAARWLGGRGAKRVMLLLAEATFEEFRDFERVEEGADHVVVGDLGEAWTYERLNTAFRALLGGARLARCVRCPRETVEERWHYGKRHWHSSAAG